MGPSSRAVSLKSDLEGCMQFSSLSLQRNTLAVYPWGQAFPHALFPASHQGCFCLSAIISFVHCAICLPSFFGNLHSALPQGSSGLKVLCWGEYNQHFLNWSCFCPPWQDCLKILQTAQLFVSVRGLSVNFSYSRFCWRGLEFKIWGVNIIHV